MSSMKVTWRDIEDGKHQDHCGGCIKFLSEMWDFPAKSRFGHGDLCSECGQREALRGISSASASNTTSPKHHAVRTDRGRALSCSTGTAW
jgi:hypothetical protein